MSVDVPEKDGEELVVYFTPVSTVAAWNVDDVVHKMDGEAVGQSEEEGW